MKKVQTNKDRLLDRFNVSGNDIDEFFAELEHLDDTTSVVFSNTGNLIPFTIIGFDGKLNGYRHTPLGTKLDNYSYQDLIGKFCASQEIINEAAKSTLIAFELNGTLYFSTPNALTTLGQRCGDLHGGYPAEKDPEIRFVRDLAYVKWAKKHPEKVKIMVRNEGGCKKAFAFFSDRYGMLNQGELIKAILASFEKEMGKVHLVKYEITNFYTDVLFEFPEKAKDFQQIYNLKEEVVPGLRLRMSDTGDASFFADGTTRVGKSTILVPRAHAERKHTKKVTVSEVVEKTVNGIFPEYTRIPERSMGLVMIDIPDPVTTINNIGEWDGFTKFSGAKARKELVKSLAEGVDPTMSYTAYDIVQMFIEQEEPFESALMPTYAELVKMRNAFTNVFFYPFEKK